MPKLNFCILRLIITKVSSFLSAFAKTANDLKWSFTHRSENHAICTKIYNWSAHSPALLKTSKEVTDFLERTQPDDSDIEYVPSSSSQGDSQQTDTTAGTQVQQRQRRKYITVSDIHVNIHHFRIV